MSNSLGSVTDGAVRQISVGPLRAEYSLAHSTVTGDWVAIGTIRSLPSLSMPPAWILVGLGDSASDAIEDLRQQMEWQAIRARLRLS
jgi:hypothetical protein